MRTSIGVLVAIWVLSWSSQGQSVDVPRIATPPTLNGALDESCWQQAAVLEDFTILHTTETTDATECRLLLDNTWLYLGFRCTHPGMLQMDQIETERDGSVHRDDSVEVFLDPGTDGALFFQFLLSFANVQADRRHLRDRGREAFWNQPWRSATQRQKDGWTAEIALPLYLVSSYGDPEKVRLNVMRNYRKVELDRMGARLREEPMYTAWSPVKKSYSEPDAFRHLTGLKGQQIREPFAVTLEAVDVGGYTKENAQRHYSVNVTVKSCTGTAGAVRVAVTDCPASGPAPPVTAECRVEPMQKQTVTVRVPVKACVRRTIRVDLSDAVSDEVLRTVTLVEPDVLNLMGNAVTDRNYYTTEERARVHLRLGMPSKDLQAFTAVVRMPDGQELARVSCPAPELCLNLLLRNVPPGKHELTVSLLNRQGRTVVEGTTVLVKRTPWPGREIKIDRFHCRLLKNGVPFFPFGLVKRKCEDGHLKRVAAAEHNAIMRWNDFSDEQVQQLMSTAAELGLDVVDNMAHMTVVKHVRAEAKRTGRAFPFAVEPENAEHGRTLMRTVNEVLPAALDEWTERTRNFRDSPVLIGYHNFDEPNLGNVQAKMAAARAIHDRIQQEDAYRPVHTIFARSVPEGGADVTDVFLYDVYIYPGWNRLSSRPNYMTKEMLELKRIADSANKPAMMMPLAEGLDPIRCPRLMFPDEQFCQTYLAVIHGAKGLFYFVDTALRRKASWDALAELASQMRIVGPAAVSGEVHPAVRYTPVELKPEDELYPDVQATLFKNPAGGYLLLAANTALHPVDVRYTVPGIEPKTGVKRLFRKQTFNVQGNGFSDSLEPYGVRAYALELVEPPGGAVQLALDLTAYPEKARPFRIFNPAKELKGRKNWVANPSFEKTTIPGVPDYVRPRKPVLKLGNAPDPAGCALDASQAVHGRFSYKETIPLPAARGRRGLRGVAYVPVANEPMPVVLSAYIRASANLKLAHVLLRAMVSDEAYEYPDGRRGDFKFFRTTTDWQRIEFRGMLDQSKVPYRTVIGDRLAVAYSIGPGNMGWVGVRGDSGTVEFWVDAVQLEVGGRATAFAAE